MTYSIRRRLMLGIACGFALLIGGAAVYAAGQLSEHLTGEFDTVLRAKVRALAALTDQEEGQIEFDYSPGDMPEFERGEDPEYFQFWLDDSPDSGPDRGMMLMRSSRLHRDLPVVVSRGEPPVFQDLPLPDGRAGRMMQIAYVPKGPDDVGDVGEVEDEIAPPLTDARQLGMILAVARDRGPLDLLLSRAQLWIAAVGAVVIALSVLLVWRALALGFRPITSIASQVEGLDAHSLTSRVQLPRTPAELAPIVDQLNGLLQRLDASFERERRFADNVAHELRTPIAELRSLAAVGAEWPEDRVSVVRFFDDVVDIARRMEGVIGDLLLLARCQAGIEQVTSSPISLRRLVDSTWAGLSAGAVAAGLRYRLDLPDDIVVSSDPGKLGILLGNLLANAVEYSRSDSEIRVRGRANGSGFRLTISNAADPLCPGDLARLTEPFWRADEARSSSEHAGLGLSLVSALAELLQLEVHFDQDPDGTFRVSIEGDSLAGDQQVRRIRKLG